MSCNHCIRAVTQRALKCAAALRTCCRPRRVRGCGCPRAVALAGPTYSDMSCSSTLGAMAASAARLLSC